MGEIGENFLLAKIYAYTVVEKIIKKRFNARKSQYEYFVKWKGY